MSAARYQMSPHILPSPLRFGLRPPSHQRRYVSSLPHQQVPVVRYFGSLSLLTHLAQHSWSLFEYPELLDMHHVGFHFMSSPEFEQEWPEATHALELLACTSASHQCCVSSSIPIIHLLPPNSQECGRSLHVSLDQHGTHAAATYIWNQNSFPEVYLCR